jgi:nucleoside-diphosphate-sugar epimerase
MKTLIIGGNGYVGSALQQHLWKNNQEVDSWDLLLFPQDLNYSTQRDYATAEEWELADYDTIVLLAGHSSVASCDNNLPSAWRNNVENFINLIGKITPQQRLIYASSSSVYGNSAEKEYWAESDSNFTPVNVYDLTKHTIDQIAKFYINQGYQICGLRFGTVNGSAPNLRVDLMLNSMVASAMEMGVININNPGIHRAVLAIPDLCRAVETLITTEMYVPGIYNLNSFNGKVAEFAINVAKLTQSDIEQTTDKPGVYDFKLDNTKFCNTYNFEFQCTVSSVIEDLKQNYQHCNSSIRNQNWIYDVE